MIFFANKRGTSLLQPYYHEIRLLHPNISIEVPNILSLISHHSIFRLEADKVNNFKRMNMELQTFRLSKVGFK
jgi:alpha-D-ribose 1-methylphosphonate 5-triphosphate synthase subunit PhnI